MIEAATVSAARPPVGKVCRRALLKGARIGLLAGTLAVVATPVCAQSDYPARPVTMVVPFAAGGVTDIMTRSLSQELQGITGQPFVVMNKPGATGIIAAQFVKASPPDGYLVMVGTGSQMSVLPALKVNVPFDPEKDFVPISLLGTTPYVLLVNPSVSAKTLSELIALMKANTGKFNYSTSGFGSLPHLAGEMFKQMAKVEMTHVPYAGNSPATTAAVSGVVQITFDTPMSSLPHVQAGTLRALAVAGAEPIDVLPGVPTMASVLPGFFAKSWLCLYVATATPEPIITKLRAVTAQSAATAAICAQRAEWRIFHPENRKRQYCKILEGGCRAVARCRPLRKHRIGMTAMSAADTATERVIGWAPLQVLRRARWGECDPAGVVYTVNFCEYVASAFELFMAELLGGPLQTMKKQHGFAVPARALTLDFLALSNRTTNF